MKIRLTDMAVKKLPSPSIGQTTYWDEHTPGFGLRCSSKAKSFVIMYGRNRRLKTLGRYPRISLADARREARLFLSEATFGKHHEVRISYEDAKNKFITDCEVRLRPITVREYRRHLNFFNFQRELSTIERAHIYGKLDELKNTPTNQNYAFTALKVFLNWCVRNQYISVNPIIADKKPARLISRDRILNEEELKTLYTHVTKERSLFHDMVALLILTGQRKTEIAHLRWDEIEDEQIILSSERTKNHRAHTIPLSPTALHILETRDSKSAYVFAGKSPENPFNGFRRVKEKLDREVNIEHFTLHDLRRTLSSNMARLNVPLHVTEKILNHQSGSFGGVAGIYNRHSYAEEMKQALKQYDTYLSELINPC